MSLDELFHGGDESGVLFAGEGREELGIVAISDSGEFGDELAACGSEGDTLKSAVVGAVMSSDELFGEQAISEFGGGSASHAGSLGKNAGRDFGLVEHFAQQDPLRHSDAAGEKFTSKGVRDVVRDKAQPEAGVAFEIAERGF
jgi:hypothetical protein